MGEKYKIYCPICGKMLCVIDDASTVEIACRNGCDIFILIARNGIITIKKTKKK